MRALMIDDCFELCSMAEFAGIRTAIDAEKGLDLLIRERPEVVFCDVHGIDSNGCDAHLIIRVCLVLGIKVYVTSSDPDSAQAMVDKYQIEYLPKIDLLTVAHAS